MFPAVLSVVLLTAPPAGAETPTIWDLTLGTPAEKLPAGFIEFACGTGGGPPGRPIAGFADFALCPQDDRGRHEVYFRYDDEAEYVARALEQSRAVEMFGGTRVGGVPVVVSALFDTEGRMAGLRLSSDPRGVPPGDRNDHWALATLLMQRHGPDGWVCEVLPLAAGETPVSSYYVKDRCTKSADDMTLAVEREYFHRRGQYFVDDFGKAQPGNFVSTTRFEKLIVP